MNRFRILRRPRGLGGHRGQALVEFVLAIPLLLLLLTGIFEFGNYFHTRISIRHSVLEATRWAVTGQLLDDPNNPGQYLTRAQSIVAVIQSKASGVPVQVQSILITPLDGGGPGDIVRIHVDYSYAFSLPLIRDYFPPNVLGFSVSTAMKNEPSF